MKLLTTAHGLPNHHAYDIARMLIQHYEFPLYHPVYRAEVEKRLLKWATTVVSLDYLVQGYIDRALIELKKGNANG